MAPLELAVVGLGGLEPPTPRLSSVCSNQLSYRPPVFSHRGVTFVFFQVSKSDLCARLLQIVAFYFFCVTLMMSPSPTALTTYSKEVIQPQVPLRLPCYDFVPVMNHTVASASLSVQLPASGTIHSHDVTGGVYKARERIHRGSADPRLLAIPTSWSRVADSNPDYEQL